jgi:hypothetical protein
MTRAGLQDLTEKGLRITVENIKVTICDLEINDL